MNGVQHVDCVTFSTSSGLIKGVIRERNWKRKDQLWKSLLQMWTLGTNQVKWIGSSHGPVPWKFVEKLFLKNYIRADSFGTGRQAIVFSGKMFFYTDYFFDEKTWSAKKWDFQTLHGSDFSPTAKLCYGVFSWGAIRCSFNTRFRTRFRRVPVKIPAEAPEGSGEDTCWGSGGLRCRYLVRFRKVPVQRP